MILARVALVAVAALVLSCGQQAELPSGTADLTDDELVLYAVGFGTAQQFGLKDMFSEEELVIVNRGFNDGVLGRSEIELQDYIERMNTLIETRRQASFSELQESSVGYLDQAALEPGAVKTESGLVYIEQTPGTGAQPSAASTVTVHYVGTLTDGTTFDSSRARGEPATFPLGRVIPGWTEGLQLMKVGGRAKMVLPPELGYGANGKPPAIPPNVALVFDIELLEIK